MSYTIPDQKDLEANECIMFCNICSGYKVHVRTTPKIARCKKCGHEVRVTYKQIEGIGEEVIEWTK